MEDELDSAQHRTFCDVLEETLPPSLAPAAPGGDAPADVLDTLRRGLIGRLAPFTTPFGQRPLVYADWTASGRAHSAVEDYVRDEVLPLYGNTHTVRSPTLHS